MGLLEYLPALRATTGAVEISILILLFSNYAEGQSCIESKPTLAVVDHCPLTAEDWASSAENKQCSALANKQKCGDPHKFEYHCLLNENNVSVEVCAPTRVLSGYCAYYDTTVGRIVMDGKKDCTKSKENPCPESFDSSDIFKYKMCYNIFEEERCKCDINIKDQSSNATISVHNLASNETDDTLKIIMFIILIVILLSLVIAYTCIWKRLKRRRHEVRRNDNSVESQPLENTAEIRKNDNSVESQPLKNTVEVRRNDNSVESQPLENTAAIKRETLPRDIGRCGSDVTECNDSDILDEDIGDEFETMDENFSPIDDSGVSNTGSNTWSSQSFPAKMCINIEFVGDQTNQTHWNEKSRNGSFRSKTSTNSGASLGTRFGPSPAVTVTPSDRYSRVPEACKDTLL